MQQQVPLDRTRGGYQPVPEALTALWRDWGYGGTTEDADLAAAVRGVQSIVDALNQRDAEGAAYRVALGEANGAPSSIEYSARRVVITSAALLDERLTPAERIGLTSVMAMHEAGHGRRDAHRQAAIERWTGAPRDEQALAHTLTNNAEDVALEAENSRLWPAYAPLYALGAWWIDATVSRGAVTVMDRLPTNTAEGQAFALTATRYDQQVQWSPDPAVQAERTWWHQWAERCAADHTPADTVRLVEEAMARVRSYGPDEQQPGEGQPGAQGEGEAEGEESESEQQGAPGEPGESGEGEGEPGEADESGSEAEGQPSKGAGAAQDGEDEAEGQSEGSGAGDADEDADEDAEGGEDAADGDADEAGEFDSGNTQRDGDADGAGEYTDEGTESESGDLQGTEGEAGQSIDYGQMNTADYEEHATGGESAAEAAEKRDGLSAPMPAHLADVADGDARNADQRVQGILDSEARQSGRETYTVTGPVEKATTARRHVSRTKIERQTMTVGIQKPGQATSGEPYWLSQKPPHWTGEQHAEKVREWHEYNDRVAREAEATAKRTMVPDTESAAALCAAFTQRRTSRDTRTVARSGRISGSRAYRVRAGFDTVFTRRDALAPDRLDVHLLIDASASMTGDNMVQAAKVTLNLASALQRLPSVRTHVWAHNSSGGTTIYDLYDERRGDPLWKIGSARTAAGNNDGFAIRALVEKITKERKPRERSVLMVMSDGAPNDGATSVSAAVAEARKRGIGVVSVAVAGGLTEMQVQCYGPKSVVPWSGDWRTLGRAMAQALAQES